MIGICKGGPQDGAYLKSENLPERVYLREVPETNGCAPFSTSPHERFPFLYTRDGFCTDTISDYTYRGRAHDGIGCTNDT